MNLTIGIVLIVLLLMTAILFFLLKREVNDINNRSKVYFTRKAQEYTDSIVRKEKENDSSKKEEKEDKRIEEENNKVQSTVVYVEKKANYEINDLLKMMKQIDDSFQVNNVNIIKLFIKHYVFNDKEKIYRYNALSDMRKYIDKVGIYNIITTYDDGLIENITKDLRLINEDIFMEYYSGKDDFDVEDFCNFLDYEMGKCDPTIYVYVGNNKFNYNEIDKRIKTIYSDDIYKGVKIVYLNKMYDYSLS